MIVQFLITKKKSINKILFDSLHEIEVRKRCRQNSYLYIQLWADCTWVQSGTTKLTTSVLPLHRMFQGDWNQHIPTLEVIRFYISVVTYVPSNYLWGIMEDCKHLHVKHYQIRFLNANWALKFLMCWNCLL